MSDYWKKVRYSVVESKLKVRQKERQEYLVGESKQNKYVHPTEINLFTYLLFINF